MNTRLRLFASILLISTLANALFSSCDKDTHCYVEVQAVYENGEPATAANILINQSRGTIEFHGVTDNSGTCLATFNAPAILSVNASVNATDPTGNVIGQRTGQGTVRTIEGETVSCRVVISNQIQPLF